MDIVSLVANARGTVEREIVNGYTHRQLAHVAGAMFRDRMLVVSVLTGALSPSKSKKTTGAPGQRIQPPHPSHLGNPDGRPKRSERVTDLTRARTAEEAHMMVAIAMKG